MDRLIRLLAIVALVVTVTAVPGNAQEQPPPEPAMRVFFGPKDGVDGGHFQATIEPGATQELTVAIGNYGQEAVDLRTYATNAHTAVNGGFAPGAEDEALAPPSTWLAYEAETYMLESGQLLERTFTITVPPDTPAGWYIAAIVVQNAEPMSMGGQFAQVVRKILGVSIEVPGEITPGAEIGTPSVTTAEHLSTLVIPITNTGNIRIQPHGSLTLRDASGAAVLEAPVQMRPIYAGHATTIELAIPGQLAAGEYTLDLELTDIDGSGWSTSIAGQALTVAAIPGEAPIEITCASVTPAGGTERGAAPAYADVSVEITNRGQSVPAARLTLVALRDGEAVEEFVLVSSLALVDPVTTVTQRYIPAEGFAAGTWTFDLVLHGLDPSSGAETVLATVAVPGTIEVGG